MPTIHRTVFLGHDLALFLPDIDWKLRYELKVRKETIVEEGQTGRQNRKPKYTALRHELACGWSLSRSVAAEVQRALIELGTPVAGERVYIGMPMPCDQLEPARWGEKIFDAQWVVEYDETGYAIHARDALPGAPARRWFAPLIVGRFSVRPKLKVLNQDEAQVTVRLLERSPWDFRLTPAVEGEVSADWPAALEANWRELPEDATEDGLTYEDVADGRVEGIDGVEKVVRRRQRFLVTCQGRAKIRTLLNFFLARKGSVQSFDAPWCHQPGDDTPETPHETRACFGADELTLVFTSDEDADVQIPMVQVPWEIAGVDGEQPEQEGEFYGYKFWLDVPPAPVVWRYTNYEHDIIRTEGGEPVTYLGDTRAMFRHDQITQAIDLSDEPVNLTSWLFDGNPLLRIVQRILDVPLQVEIVRGKVSAPNAAVVVYSGEVLDVVDEDRSLQAETAVLGGLLDVKVPGFFFGPNCGYRFCGPGCNHAGAMPPENFTFAGTIVSQVGNVLTIAVTDNPPGHLLTADYFAKGWIKCGEGVAFELKQIVRSAAVVGSNVALTLKRPLRAAPGGAAVSFMPFCTGTKAECQFWGNYINFGGHPDIGAKNLSVPRREVNVQGGKK